MKLFVSFLALTMLLFASFWAIIHPWASHQVSKTLARIALVLGLALLLMGWWATPTALGEVQFLKEADQWIYQAGQTLIDTEGRSWAIAAFKPMDSNRHGFYVRATARAPYVRLDAVAPLTIKSASGKYLSAPNVTRQQFIGDLPDPDVGQYDIQSLLPQLKTMPSLQLQLPAKDAPVTIVIPPDTLEEWLLVGSCDYLICAPSSNNGAW